MANRNENKINNLEGFLEYVQGSLNCVYLDCKLDSQIHCRTYELTELKMSKSKTVSRTWIQQFTSVYQVKRVFYKKYLQDLGKSYFLFASLIVEVIKICTKSNVNNTSLFAVPNYFKSIKSPHKVLAYYKLLVFCKT